METFRLIGIMSGTSLDGIDIACCSFSYNNHWSYDIEHSTTCSYSDFWKKRLAKLHHSSAIEYAQTNADLGILIGELTAGFIQKNNITDINAIASHGHTIFHQPDKKLTTQIGAGSHIAAITGIPTICDFRNTDVALGGQGAPLVPIGDTLLFNEYDYCLNLGGIANVSFTDVDQRKSFDLGFANMASNYLMLGLEQEYDKDGLNAQQGNVHHPLLEKLNSLEYFQKAFPKSLGKEYFETDFKPILDSFAISTQDKLATFATHITDLICDFLHQNGKGKVLITGGGAYNKHWINFLKEKSESEIIIPSPTLIDNKEALIFAFLGLLRIQKKNNCLSSVTGSTRDSIGGCIYL